MARRTSYSPNPLQGLTETQGSLLAPGETFQAAAKARTVPGTPTASQLPPAMLWAVTQRRLIVWAAPNRGELGPPALTLEIGPVLNRATIQPYEGAMVALTVFAADHPAIVLMDVDDARAIAAVIDEVVKANVAPPPIPETAPVATPDLPPIDPSLGDAEVAKVLDSLADQVWEEAEAAYGVLDAHRRELVVTNIAGQRSLAALDAWAAARPDNPDPFVLRGAARVAWAFDSCPNVAGGSQAVATDRTQANIFHGRLRAAEADLWQAVELDFASPTPWTPLIKSARGLQIGQEEMCMRFDEAVRRTPGLLIAHMQILIGLSRIWGGSHAAMFAYADAMARPAEEGSPLHALMPFAHILRSLDDADDDPRQRYFTSTVLRDISVFAQVSVDSPAWVDDATTVEVLNIFTLAFHLCGEHSRARELWGRVGGRRTAEPWALVPQSDAILADLAG